MECSGSRQKTSGKPPDLSLLLKASKHQLSMGSFRVCYQLDNIVEYNVLYIQAALLNEAFQLLLQYFTEHAHYIGFPELVYPVLVRVSHSFVVDVSF